MEKNSGVEHGFKLPSALSNITGQSGRNLLNVLITKGCINTDNVIASVGKRIKKPIEEIEAAVCGSLNTHERKLLSLILRKIDVAEIQSLMPELSEPYSTAVDQLDSIPGIDATAALAIVSEISASPHD